MLPRIRNWDVSLRSLPYHVLLLCIGTALGVGVLVLRAITLNIPPPQLPDLLPYVLFFRTYRPEPQEAYLYHWGLIVVPTIACLFWYGMLWWIDRMDEQFKRRVRSIATHRVFLSVYLMVVFTTVILILGLAYTKINNIKLISFINNARLELMVSIVLGGILIQSKKLCPSITLGIAKIFSSPLREGLGIAIILFFLFWNPSFKIFFGLNEGLLHHYSFFLGPINDILHGKIQLVSTESQYGILLTSFLGFVYQHIAPLSLTSFYAITMGITMLYYGMLYYILRIVLDSKWYAFLGICLAYSIHILAINGHKPPFEAYIFPSVTPLRFIFDIPLFFCIYQYAKTRNILFAYAGSCLSAVALFYNFEIGISLLVSFVLSILFVSWQHTHQWKQACGIAMKPLVVCLMVISILFVSFSCITFIKSGVWPDWIRWYYFAQLYASGFGALPIVRIIAPYQVLLAVYAVNVYWIILEVVFRRIQQDTALRLGLTIYGLLIFHYYLNRSHTNNLFVVSIPAAMLLILLLARVARITVDQIQNLNKGQKMFYRLLKWGMASFITLCIIIQVPNFFLVLANRYFNPYRHTPSYQWHMRASTFSEPYVNPAPFEEARDAIKIATRNHNTIPILSRYDFLYHFMSGTANTVNFYNLENQVRTWSDLQKIINEIKRENPPYLFYDHNATYTRDQAHMKNLLTNYRVHTEDKLLTEHELRTLAVQYGDAYALTRQRSNVIELIFAGIADQYTFKARAGNLDLYEHVNE